MDTGGTRANNRNHRGPFITTGNNRNQLGSTEIGRAVKPYFCASKSKYGRAFASSDELNAGNWHLPDPQIAPWVNEFLFEASAFPRGKHDDRLDAWTQAQEALSGADVADYSMYTAENVARFEAGVMRMGYRSDHFIPPGLRRWPW